MYAKILISVIGILIVIGTCQPMPPNTNMMPGVFISSETLKSMEDKARVNSQNNNNQMQNSASIQPNSSPTEMGNQQSTNFKANQPNIQMNSNSETTHAPVYQVPTSVNSQQPMYANQQSTYSNQQPAASRLEMVPINTQQQMNSQPIIFTQPQNQQSLNQQPIILAQQPNQQYVLTPSNEPNQQAILVSQPNQQTMLVNPQNNQPLLITPQNNQPLLVNPQNNQPLLVTPQNQPLIVTSNQLPNVVVQNGVGPPVVSNPNMLGRVIANQNGALVGNTLQNSGNQIYAVVPLNNQHVPNNNVNNGNTYLVPVQQVPSNTVLVNTGK